MPSFYEKLKERAKELGMAREEFALYAAKRQGEFTVDDYRRLPDEVRAELIDGELIYMEAPDYMHQELIMELSVAFVNCIRANKGTCRVALSPLDVQLDCDDRTMVQPDLVVICDEKKIVRKGICGAPDLCVEVLSPSTRKKDCTLKVQKYMNAGVREYWIVDPDKKTVLTYRFEGEDSPCISMYTFQDKVPVGIFGGCPGIDFREISGRLLF